MRLREVMTTQVETTHADESAENAFQRMKAQAIPHLVVLSGAFVTGVLSDSDLGGDGGHAFRQGKTVGEVMTPSVLTATPDMSISATAELLRGRKVSCVPVLEGGKLVGTVTATELLKLIEESPAKEPPRKRGGGKARVDPSGQLD